MSTTHPIPAPSGSARVNPPPNKGEGLQVQGVPLKFKIEGTAHVNPSDEEQMHLARCEQTLVATRRFFESRPNGPLFFEQMLCRALGEKPRQALGQPPPRRKR